MEKFYTALNYEIVPECQSSKIDVSSVRRLSLRHAVQNILSSEIIVTLH